MASAREWQEQNRLQIQQQKEELQAEAEMAKQTLEAEHQEAEQLAQALISKLLSNRQTSEEWRQQVEQMLAAAPITVAYDATAQQDEVQKRFRLRPSVIAGLLLCAGIAGFAGFSNFALSGATASRAVTQKTAVLEQLAPVEKVNGGLHMTYELAAPADQAPSQADEGSKVTNTQLALAGSR